MNKEQRLVKRHSSRVAFLVYLSPRKASINNHLLLFHFIIILSLLKGAIIDQLYLEVDERNEEVYV